MSKARRYNMAYYGHERPHRITDSMDGCRDADCCGGSECGWAFEEVRKRLADQFRKEAEQIEKLNEADLWLLYS